MNKQEAIDALVAAGRIKDRHTRKQRMQQILDAFERHLRGLHESCNNHATPCPTITTKEPSRPGGQRAIPPNIVPEVHKLKASGLSCRKISKALADDYGLSVNRTTVNRAINGKGIYGR